MTNRFKGLDLTDRELEGKWTEVKDIVQEAVIKTIPKKTKCKKAKWMFDETLQIAEKRREAKGKGGKERYTHLNAEFQRLARRDKKAFLTDQCKEREENTILCFRVSTFALFSLFLFSCLSFEPSLNNYFS